VTKDFLEFGSTRRNCKFKGTARDTSHISERCQGATRLRREVPDMRDPFDSLRSLRATRRRFPGSSFQSRKSADDALSDRDLGGQRCTVSAALSA
jgi:hypothetical protein